MRCFVLWRDLDAYAEKHPEWSMRARVRPASLKN
jgi:hypothetical protein